MVEPTVRISQGFFEPQMADAVSDGLKEGQPTLEAALRRLGGLRHYNVSLDRVSNSMVIVSV